MDERIKQAIQSWQEESKEKRAILLIAVEEKECKENVTTAENSVAVIGRGKLLVEAVKCVKTEGGIAADIFNKADMSMLLEKLRR